MGGVDWSGDGECENLIRGGDGAKERRGGEREGREGW